MDQFINFDLSKNDSDIDSHQSYSEYLIDEINLGYWTFVKAYLCYLPHFEVIDIL